MVLDRLISQATEFASDVATLLNGTVADGAHVGVVFDSRTGHCRVATGISTREMKAKPVPLVIGRGKASAHLEVSHRLVLDHTGEHLADASSSYAVLVGRDEPVVRFDYERDKQGYPEAHIHVVASPTHSLPSGVKALQRLHLPVGPRRFRPALEDVIEFVVREGFATARQGWENVVAEHRAKWLRRQLMAAVRRDPEAALEQLKADGHL